MQPKPHQIKHNAAVIEAYDQGWRQQITSMATGTGKTFCFSTLYEELKSRLPGKMLVLAHREELIDQSIKSLKLANPTLRIDKEMAEHKADPVNADIVVACVGSLGRKNTPRLAKYDGVKFDKFVVDEAHHSTADSYKNIFEHFKLLENGNSSLLLGVTATTNRADGVALGTIYKKMPYVYSLRQAIKDGVLVDIRGYRVYTNTDLSNVDTSNNSKIVEAIDSPERNRRVARSWAELCWGMKTVIYAGSIKHAQNIVQAFYDSNIFGEIRAVWGEDPDREAKLEWHKNTPAGVLVNCDLLVEGYDDPSISCVVLAAPTDSPVRFTQMCGRATRLYPGKSHCIILDITDRAGTHSLCTLPSLMGLPAGMDIQGQSLLEILEAIEAAQEANPDIDFTKLQAPDKLKHYIDQINLFTIRFPKEVEDNSDFRWKQAIDGGYLMNVPRPKLDSTGTPPGLLRITQNLLDKWEVTGYLRGRGIYGLRDSMEEAFAAADQVIRERTPESVALVNRKASWAMKPCTKAQKTMLNRLYKGTAWPEDLTAGQASEWIDKKLNKQTKG